jgi:hypothetical protein
MGTRGRLHGIDRLWRAADIRGPAVHLHSKSTGRKWTRRTEVLLLGLGFLCAAVLSWGWTTFRLRERERVRASSHVLDVDPRDAAVLVGFAHDCWTSPSNIWAGSLEPQSPLIVVSLDAPKWDSEMMSNNVAEATTGSSGDDKPIAAPQDALADLAKRNIGASGGTLRRPVLNRESWDRAVHFAPEEAHAWIFSREGWVGDDHTLRWLEPAAELFPSVRRFFRTDPPPRPVKPPKGWMACSFPGYSSDGRTAVVWAQVGPGRHMETMVAVLSLTNGVWRMNGRRVFLYL